MAKEKLNFVTIDVKTLPPKVQALANEALAAKAAFTKSSEAFKAFWLANAKPPEGKEFVFAFNFGKPAVALKDKSKESSSAKAPVDFSALFKK
jgi:hypothetical protein